MKKLSILIIGLFTLLLSANLFAEEPPAAPLTPNWTYFQFDKNIMEPGVDLSTAIISICIDPVYNEDGDHIFGILEIGRAHV